MQEISKNYSEAIGLIKSAILKSRYRAAALANKELLSLYYGIGGYISANSRKGTWGTNAIEVISEQLQKELPGLRGFSSANIKKMRIFHEEWQEDFSAFLIRSLVMNELKTDDLQNIETMQILNRSSAMNDLKLQNVTINTDFPLQQFLQVGFTHHCEIMYNVKSREERLFYIQKCASEFWSVENLQYHPSQKQFIRKTRHTTQQFFYHHFGQRLAKKSINVVQRRILASFCQYRITR